MANRNGTYAASTISIKLATLALFVVLILHTVGFSIPHWVTIGLNTPGADGEYHAGLWQHCACATVLDTGACLCLSRTNDPLWMRLVQAMETLALIGFIFSLVISLGLICYKQKQKYKHANFILLVVSGALGITGAIIFGIKTAENLENFEGLVGGSSSMRQLDIGHSHLSYAFIVSLVACCLSILTCAPLYLKDICNGTQETTQESTVYYTPQGQGQIYNPQHGPRQDGPQMGGNVPHYYANPQYILPPPAYETNEPYPGIPYKS